MAAIRKFFQNATMKAVRVAQFGGVENLKLETNVSVPKPLADEVLIRIKAAGINPVDTYIRQGAYSALPSLPYTPGKDGAGIIEDVGEGVKSFQKGDRVISVFNQTGSYSEYCTAKVMHVCPLHESLTFIQGAAIGIPYYTACGAIFNKAQAKPGDTVLVHGASGGVGIATVQMLKAHGCVVIGTAGTQEGMDLVSSQGADRVFNHKNKGYMETILQEVTGGCGVDVIIEMLANVNLKDDMAAIGHRGRIVIVGSRGPIEIDPRLTMLKESIITALALFATHDDEWKAMHATILAGQRTGWLKPQVGKVYSMEDAGKGQHDVIHNSGTMGKLVIDTSL